MSYGKENWPHDTNHQHNYSDYYPTQLLTSLTHPSHSQPDSSYEAADQRHRTDTQVSGYRAFSLDRRDGQASLTLPVPKERAARSTERRDLSKGRGVSPSSLLELDELCDACDSTGLDLSYCNVCNTNLCSECWPRQAPHRKQRFAPGNVPHEKTDIAVAKKIQRALVPTSDLEQLTQLYEEDEQTAWFGEF